MSVRLLFEVMMILNEIPLVRVRDDALKSEMYGIDGRTRIHGGGNTL